MTAQRNRQRANMHKTKIRSAVQKLTDGGFVTRLARGSGPADRAAVADGRRTGRRMMNLFDVGRSLMMLVDSGT